MIHEIKDYNEVEGSSYLHMSQSAWSNKRNILFRGQTDSQIFIVSSSNAMQVIAIYMLR